MAMSRRFPPRFLYGLRCRGVKTQLTFFLMLFTHTPRTRTPGPGQLVCPVLSRSRGVTMWERTRTKDCKGQWSCRVCT